jgi:hypothetical protein
MGVEGKISLRKEFGGPERSVPARPNGAHSIRLMEWSGLRPGRARLAKTAMGRPFLLMVKKPPARLGMRRPAGNQVKRGNSMEGTAG